MGKILAFILGLLRRGGSNGKARFADGEVHIAIGQVVQLQDDWKTPPYAMTILGRPEAVDENTVRVPARITSVLPRWIAESHQLALVMVGVGEERDDDWTTNDGDVSDFLDVILVKGGSHDGYVHLRPETGNQSSHIPQFDRLTFLDGSEQIIDVDLTQEAPVAPRVHFANGSISPSWDDPHSYGPDERLGSMWADSPVSTRLGIGDTAKVIFLHPHSHVEDRFLLTVLAPPETVDERTVRIRLRITCLEEQGGGYKLLDEMDLGLSGPPDSFGRIHQLWPMDSGSATGKHAYEDSLADKPIVKDATYEGYAYFRPPNDEQTAPDKGFAILWYGYYLFEQPIDLIPT